jgi:preprotein translocase subunit YajC
MNDVFRDAFVKSIMIPAAEGKHSMRRSLLILTSSFLLLFLASAASAQDAPSGQGQPQGQPDGQQGPGGQRGGRFRGNGVFGRIQSIAPGEIKIAAPDGSTVTVKISSKTNFRIEQQTAKLEDFKVGTAVFVRGTKTGDSTWDADAVSARNGPPPMTQGGGPGGPGGGRGNMIAGTVKSIDGAKITIARLDNTTQTVELDENTSLSRHRESITLADVHPGDAIAVRGETKDGAFVPRSVSILDQAQLERMKQFMNSQGAGGPGGGNPPPQPPPDKKPDPQPQQELH